MRLLVDNEIIAALLNPAGNALAYALEGNPPQPTQISSAHVKPTSLDLTIGKIFIPGTPPNEIGGSNNGKNEHNLDQGHTAGHLEKFLSPSLCESDSLTARGNGRMEEASHGAEGLFRC